MSIITLILVLSFLIFFHELGHYLAAKFFGVKVYTFSIGFGKQIYSKNWNGTIWQISLIPLGGYVRMKGQDDSNPNLTENGFDSYNAKKPWQRIVILFAGPFANFVLASILYFIIAIMGPTAFSPKVGSIQDDSPAFYAGLQVNDEILVINDKKIKSWDDIGSIVTKSDSSLQFYIKRDNQVITKIITPYISDSQNIFREQIKKRMIGISPIGEVKELDLSLLESLNFAYEKTIFASTVIFQGIQKLISGVIPSSEIGGVISIGKVISEASENSIIALLSITALISVNLGVINLLPIPALDGGHIVFNLYEMIFRRKPSEKVFIFLTLMGWIILGSLMILGLYNDINRIFLGN